MTKPYEADDPSDDMPQRTSDARPECKAADSFICEWLDCPVHGEHRTPEARPGLGVGSRVRIGEQALVEHRGQTGTITEVREVCVQLDGGMEPYWFYAHQLRPCPANPDAATLKALRKVAEATRASLRIWERATCEYEAVTSALAEYDALSAAPTHAEPVQRPGPWEARENPLIGGWWVVRVGEQPEDVQGHVAIADCIVRREDAELIALAVNAYQAPPRTETPEPEPVYDIPGGFAVGDRVRILEDENAPLYGTVVAPPARRYVFVRYDEDRPRTSPCRPDELRKLPVHEKRAVEETKR